MYKAKTFDNFAALAGFLNETGSDLRAYNVRPNQKVDALVFEAKKTVAPVKKVTKKKTKKVTKKKVSGA